jgi:hypothetical protein
MDEVDRRLVNALQGGFPIAERPFAAVGEALGLPEAEVIERLRALREAGVLSRFGPRFEEVTPIVNAFPEVAHNYRREHALNMWFVLATGTPAAIDAAIARIEAATGLSVLNLPKLEEFFLELKLAA